MKATIYVVREDTRVTINYDEDEAGNETCIPSSRTERHIEIYEAEINARFNPFDDIKYSDGDGDDTGSWHKWIEMITIGSKVMYSFSALIDNSLKGREALSRTEYEKRIIQEIKNYAERCKAEDELEAEKRAESFVRE